MQMVYLFKCKFYPRLCGLPGFWVWTKSVCITMYEHTYRCIYSWDLHMFYKLVSLLYIINRFWRYDARWSLNISVFCLWRRDLAFTMINVTPPWINYQSSICYSNKFVTYGHPSIFLSSAISLWRTKDMLFIKDIERFGSARTAHRKLDWLVFLN